MALPTRVCYICFRNSSISLLILCILSLAYETTLKHIVQMRKFQQSSTFFLGGCAFFTFLCHEIIDKSVVCYIWFKYTSLRLKSYMFGEDHWVQNLPRDARHKTSSMWVEKSNHVWEKPLSICVFMKWQKPNMCGFYQTLQIK